MRVVFVLFFLGLSGFVRAQGVGSQNIPLTASEIAGIGGSFTLNLVDKKNAKSKKTVDGSPYLFKSWDNNAKVYLDNKVYVFNMFNYNAYAERFEAKVSEDSVYIINPKGVDKVVILNRAFKRYLDPEYQRNSYFEEIFKSDNFLLLRKYYTTLREPNINPLTKVPEGLPELLQNEDFYVLKTDNEKLEKIKFRKKSVLDLIPKNQQKVVQSYVKKNNLKYNNLHDIVTILKYYIALSA
ncbi:hypothetical protein HPE56_10115 [Maribacter sp. ANRC-HE7]|uniref:DUF4369 domain-containing protein n=1 Tax=Maribacter aquimaris TaxID=2737171 RepID=A0ABR7V023_9FLAO|nr:hypothetical protein [Maribacter aquimaris]MBD0778148.1 hypothetical protein [Maribacter aquimaris]